MLSYSLCLAASLCRMQHVIQSNSVMKVFLMLPFDTLSFIILSVSS